MRRMWRVVSRLDCGHTATALFEADNASAAQRGMRRVEASMRADGVITRCKLCYDALDRCVIVDCLNIAEPASAFCLTHANSYDS